MNNGNLYELCRDEVKLRKWLIKEGLPGDFSGICLQGKVSLKEQKPVKTLNEFQQ